MTVAELIKQLERFDPDEDIVVFDPNNGVYLEIIEVDTSGGLPAIYIEE